MTDPGHLDEATRARAGRRPRAPSREERRAGQAVRARAHRAAARRRARFVEEALLANWEPDGLGADGVVTGVGDDRRPPGRRHGQRLDREGRLVGPEDGREDPPHPGARARACACPLFYLVDSAGARITDQVEMFPGRRGAGRIFYNEVQLSGRRAAGLPALRPVRRRRRVHPGVLRRRGHGRRQRLDVPRLAAHGRDGDRREGDARGDGRRARCTAGLRLRRRARARPRRRRSASPGATSRTCPSQLRAGAAGAPAAPRRRRSTPIERDHPGRREQALRHDGADRRARSTRARFFEIKQLCRQGADHRLRAHRRARRRASSPTSRSTRAACSSSTRPTRPRASSGSCDAFNIPLLFLADVPGLHDRHQGRAPGHHPRRRQDDHRGQRGDRAEDLASSCARPTAPASTRCAGPASSPTHASRCRRASIAVMGPEAAVNAVYFNKIQARGPRRARGDDRGAAAHEYAADIDILQLARELVIDAVVARRRCATSSSARFAHAGAEERATGRPSATPSHRSRPRRPAPRRSHARTCPPSGAARAGPWPACARAHR